MLDTLDVFEKREIVKSIFYNPHAPQTKDDPMIMAIILHVMGISKDRYKISKKYGHWCGGHEYNKEDLMFRSVSDVKADVHEYFEKRQVSEPSDQFKG